MKNGENNKMEESSIARALFPNIIPPSMQAGQSAQLTHLFEIFINHYTQIFLPPRPNVHILFTPPSTLIPHISLWITLIFNEYQKAIFENDYLFTKLVYERRGLHCQTTNVWSNDAEKNIPQLWWWWWIIRNDSTDI